MVGDGTVGKTSFIIRFDRDEFIEDVVRRVDGSLESDVIVDGKYFEVALWDTRESLALSSDRGGVNGRGLLNYMPKL